VIVGHGQDQVVRANGKVEVGGYAGGDEVSIERPKVGNERAVRIGRSAAIEVNQRRAIGRRRVDALIWSRVGPGRQVPVESSARSQGFRGCISGQRHGEDPDIWGAGHHERRGTWRQWNPEFKQVAKIVGIVVARAVMPMGADPGRFLVGQNRRWIPLADEPGEIGDGQGGSAAVHGKIAGGDVGGGSRQEVKLIFSGSV